MADIDPTHFTLGAICHRILEPIRNFINQVGAGANLTWSPVPSNRTIAIIEDNDATLEAMQELPRIVVSRGPITVGKQGLATGLTDAVSFSETKGDKNENRLTFYRGVFTITCEASTKGQCELIADMVTHFIVWTRPELRDSQGFKELGEDITIGDCVFTETENPNLAKHSVTIQVPWSVEERWNIRTSSPLLKKVTPIVTPVAL